ncbi:MAG: hypothetical protein ABEJ03_03610 [Candidatus Nanohaloarchaea archaeon]
MTDSKFEKELRLESDDAAEFLRNLAASIEEEDGLALEGDEWQVYQPFEDVVPFRLVKDDEDFEVGLKLIQPE